MILRRFGFRGEDDMFPLPDNDLVQIRRTRRHLRIMNVIALIVLDVTGLNFLGHLEC